MTPAEIYRYSNRAMVDASVRAMQERIVEELRAERQYGIGLDTQSANGRGVIRNRLGRTQAWQEAWDATAQHYRDEYMRIEREVTASWGWDA